MKRWILRGLLFLALFLALSGCRITDVEEGEQQKVDYTVLKVGEIPPEVEEILNEKKDLEFQTTYASAGYLYILRGYGQQKSGGFSIRIEDFYRSDHALHVKMTLIGPATKEEQKGVVSCPYVVLRTEADEDMPVVFEE